MAAADAALRELITHWHLLTPAAKEKIIDLTRGGSEHNQSNIGRSSGGMSVPCAPTADGDGKCDPLHKRGSGAGVVAPPPQVIPWVHPTPVRHPRVAARCADDTFRSRSSH
jgi:hypothetical protein